MTDPAIARALGGRLWERLAVAIAALGLTAVFATLVDAGWDLAQSALGAVIGGAALWLGGVLVQQRVSAARQGSP